MCYSVRCFYEDNDGECNCLVSKCGNKIYEATKHMPCFIGGGAIETPEDVKEYEELFSNGTIDKCKKIVGDILESERRK